MVKVVYKDSIQSIRSWEAAVTWLALCINEVDNKAWYHHTLYRSLRKQLLREYQLPPCEKYPFTIKQLAMYTAHRKCFPGRYRTIAYDTLLEVTWIQLLFMTMSRPSELLNRPCDANKYGLRLKDIVRITHFDYAYFDLAIWHFKNQKRRRAPKSVTVNRVSCRRRQCLCRIVNPYRLLRECLYRRKAMQPFLSTKSQRDYFAMHHDSLFFVRSSGHRMTTVNTSQIIKTMAIICRVLEPQCYSEYSLRVGGATHCSAAGIPDALMYRYVGWDPNQLPDIAKRYQRPTLEMRLEMQNYMLHGFVQDNGTRHGIRHLPGMIHDPWDKGDPKSWRN